MTRQEFLTTVWSPYPPAHRHWVDVSSFQDEKTPVCGRLHNVSGSDGQLSSGGETLHFRFASGCRWLQEQKRPLDFEPALLHEGDLICIKLTRHLSEGLIAEEVLLLAPMLKPPVAIGQPAAFDVNRSHLWADFLHEVRVFFRERKFIEAWTPTLVPSPGTEPFLEPFVTEWQMGSFRREFYLPTSPEFHLKKMLVRGWPRLFEFKSCFRNGEISEHHQPEFQMLEWYRAYSDLDAIAEDVEALLLHLARCLGAEKDKSLRLQRVTMAELFAQAYSGFLLRPTTSREELASLARREGITMDESDSWDDLFFRLFLERIEPHLGMKGPLLVRGYPPSQAALSRIGADGFADRFEVYWRGLELGNAFHELNDPHENENRFVVDAKKKQELGKPAVPADQELIEDLYSGMPPAGGIAMGLDRLFMALFDLKTIAETRAFPIRRLD